MRPARVIWIIVSLLFVLVPVASIIVGQAIPGDSSSTVAVAAPATEARPAVGSGGRQADAAAPAPAVARSDAGLAQEATPTAMVLIVTPTATATATGPTTEPTPTPRPPGTPWRVGLQVGHWKSEELPEELARLRTSTGARYGNVTEAELNYSIADRVRVLLEREGIVVDLLPATVPPRYDADAFIAFHADGNRSSGPRGWKIATPWRTSAASRQLMQAIAAVYGPMTGLPEDRNGITVNMRGYYAFNYRRHEHAIARTTPAVILEMGYMSNPADREVLFGQPDRVAAAVAQGILGYLAQRDPNDGAALLPPDFPVMRAKSSGAQVRAAPNDRARLLAEMTAEDRITPFNLQDGWYEGFVRGPGRSRVIGWVRADQVESTEDPVVFPTPTNP